MEENRKNECDEREQSLKTNGDKKSAHVDNGEYFVNRAGWTNQDGIDVFLQ